ncbi:hypothetical protein [Hymenobacter sp. DG01]|uniref:hypothetical protein n=1 Tax=Hymenobacter sp. DG01 TaxID=2584940 RepID=UPI0011235E0C|nr:hypothetical protein [Hymenobacter sp. DG01]
MSIALLPPPSAPVAPAHIPAYVALAGIYFQHGCDWLELGESSFLEVGLSSTITLLEGLTCTPTRAAIGSLRQGNYKREGRTLSREQLLSELEAAPVAFRALVDWDGEAQAWMVQLHD